jgi:hypothetical protein
MGGEMKKLMYLSLISICIMSCYTFENKSINTSFLDYLETSGLELKNVQFYNSQEIKLERPIDKSEFKKINGKLVFANENYYDDVVIKIDTPCILVGKTDETITVRFEEGENKVLTFEKKPANNNCYKLRINESINLEAAKNEVTYGPYTYKVISGLDCYLSIKQAIINRKITEKKIVPGMLVQ